MEKGSKKNFNNGKALLKKHFRDKGYTAEERYKPPDYNRFPLLIEKYFLEDETGITDGLVEQFRKELTALDLSKEDIFLNLVHYFAKIFWTAELKATSKPLHTSRDYALEIYAKVFSDMFRELKEPVRHGKSPVYKGDFILFLVGISDGPFHDHSITDKMVTFSGTDETVLITGETGTGKELHAKAIHYLSPRAKEKFVAINCAGIPEMLLESELFGYEKGAFTGASKTKKGLLEEVDKGTLFLDEIGDMSIPLQSKVLRVLQSGDYRRVGGTKALQFKGRVIAATNKDLQAEIEKETPLFRSDLFYRLNVLPIKLPSFRTLELRERIRAIMTKLRHIIQSKTDQSGNWSEMSRISGPSGRDFDSEWDRQHVEPPFYSVHKNSYITSAAINLLSQYPFQGNYRELDNIIRRVHILSGGNQITEHLLRSEGIASKRIKLQEKGRDEASVSTIMLKDILEHADRVKADVVRGKVEAVYRSGQNLKQALAAEGMDVVSDYQNFRNKIKTIIGKKEIGKIIKEYKPKK